MFQSSFGSLLNHLYHYATGNVSARHLSLICITSILTTIYSLKICSFYGRPCRNYSPKSFGFFCKEFRRVLKKIKMLFTSLGRSVKGKTVPSHVRMWLVNLCDFLRVVFTISALESDRSTCAIVEETAM